MKNSGKKQPQRAGNGEENRVGTIAAVKTPLGLLVLIALVVEGSLLGLALRAKGADFTLLVVGMLLALVLLIVFGYLLIKNTTTQPKREEGSDGIHDVHSNFKYNVFVSSLMAAHGNDEEYKHSREEAVKFAACLRIKCKFPNIYYAGLDISTKGDFDAADISAEDVLDAIKDSRYFVLIYPSKIVSSSLLETGCALALRKPSVYFVHSRSDLPFLMQKAEQAFPNNVKIHECESMSMILKLLEKHGERLFPS